MKSHINAAILAMFATRIPLPIGDGKRGLYQLAVAFGSGQIGRGA